MDSLQPIGPTEPSAATEPSTSTEPGVRDVLAGIWADVLHVVPQDDDDFFDLGGDSLAMIKVLFAVEDRFGTEMSVEELFADSFTFAAGVAAVTEALTAPLVSG